MPQKKGLHALQPSLALLQLSFSLAVVYKAERECNSCGDPCTLLSICCVLPSANTSPLYSIIGRSLYDPSSLPIYAPSFHCENIARAPLLIRDEII